MMEKKIYKIVDDGRRASFYFGVFYSLIFPMIFERIDYISTAGAGRGGKELIVHYSSLPFSHDFPTTPPFDRSLP